MSCMTACACLLQVARGSGPSGLFWSLNALIRADFVGRNLPTRLAEDVRVRLVETDEVPEDVIELWGPPGVGGEEGDA